jgi:hypothetical protein
MTIGAIFTQQFHRSAPRVPGTAQRVRNTATKQEVTTATATATATTKRNAATAPKFEAKTRDVNEEIWKAYGLDEGWGPWFLVP